MTQEDKELLLHDLCCRLPYDVKIEYNGNVYLLVRPWLNFVQIANGAGEKSPSVNEIKPYLRSFKSMTKDERSEYYRRCKSYHYKREWKWGRTQYGETLYKKEPRSYTVFYRTPEALDYLNSIHVDYRGLLKKGLAIKAPKEMY